MSYLFFDWDNKGDFGPQDGGPDHTGIVDNVEKVVIYTIEGNSGDACRERMYPLEHNEMLGCGDSKRHIAETLQCALGSSEVY